MIPRTPPTCQVEDTTLSQTSTPSLQNWQSELAGAVREPSELLELLQLPQSLLTAAAMASQLFPLRVPRGYVQRMEKGNKDDPLLRQVLPLHDETIENAEYSFDPVGDLAAVEVPGLLHKYYGRVLLITTPACAVHCRYCFRRHFPYQENRAEQDWSAAIEYIHQHSEIHEVILSGGDPLSLTESKLKNITDKLMTISHIKTLRIHTRQPIVLPERVTSSLLEWLASLPWKIVIVLHCNHANEIDESVAIALEKLQQKNITLLNQSVLLAGVNNDSETLITLSHRLFKNGVLPYYLHLLDKVQGASHFHVSYADACQIISESRKILPGYLVPKLVQENSGENAKTPVM